jgi:hypothetical protein
LEREKNPTGEKKSKAWFAVVVMARATDELARLKIITANYRGWKASLQI